MSMSFNEAVNTIKLIRDCTINNGLSIVPLLLGETGIGKTELVRELCEEEGLSLITIHVSQIEPADLTGLYKINEWGKTDNCSPSWLPWLEVESFNEIKESKRCSADKLKTLTSGLINPKGGIVFLDEVNRGHEDIRQSLYQLLNERRMHTFTLPSNYTIVAAANPSNGYETYEFDAALINRFAWIDFKPSAKETMTYLGNKYLASPMVSWLNQNTELLALSSDIDNSMDEQKKLSPRIVEQACILLKEMDARQEKQLFKNKVLRSIMTKGNVDAFLAFDTEAQNAVTIEEIFKGKFETEVQGYVKAQRNDVMSIITERLAVFFFDYTFHTQRTKEEDEMVKNVVKFFSMIPSAFSVAFANTTKNKYYVDKKTGKHYIAPDKKLDLVTKANENHLLTQPEFRADINSKRATTNPYDKSNFNYHIWQSAHIA